MRTLWNCLFRIWACLCLDSGCSFAQTRPGPNFNPRSVGDYVPESAPITLLADSPELVRQLPLRGKLTILDFWSTGCSSCIQLMPHLAKLQEHFGDRIQIIAVNSQSATEARKPYIRRPDLATLKLTRTVNDTVLSAWFPHVLLPHEAWIDSQGRVLAITGHQELTPDNIRLALERPGSLRLTVKRDVLDYDSEKPLLLFGNGGSEDAFLARSVITGRNEGIGSGGSTHSPYSWLTALRVINQSLPELYKTALGLPAAFPAKQINWQVSDADSLRTPGVVFCYDALVPVGRNPGNWMLQDLDRFFNLEGVIEKRVMNCLALVRSDTSVPLTSVAAKSAIALSNDPHSKQFLLHSRLSNLTWWLNEQPDLPVVLDETNYKAPVDLGLNQNLHDTAALNQILAKYGLKLIPVQRELRIMVIRRPSLN